MRDGLLFGVALFFIIGAALVFNDAYLQYTDICQRHTSGSDPFKPVQCDPSVIYFAGALGIAFIAMGGFAAWAWTAGRKEAS